MGVEGGDAKKRLATRGGWPKKYGLQEGSSKIITVK